MKIVDLIKEKTFQILDSKFSKYEPLPMFEFPLIENGMWVDSINIEGKNIEIRNYGMVTPKGYKLGFAVDGVLLSETLTCSKEFKIITGTNTFDDRNKLLNLYGNFMIIKHRKEIFNMQR